MTFEASCTLARLRVHHISPTCDITIACRRLSPSIESLDRSHCFLALSPIALLMHRPRHRPSTGNDAFIFIGDERSLVSRDQICSINQSVNESLT